MAKTENVESEQSAEFDLKHRVTGAAVLLFFGALVLPWLLGPPSEASKIVVTNEVAAISEVEPANIVADSKRVDPDAVVIDIEETVYISKITPLDAKGNRDLIKAANDAAKSTSLKDGPRQNQASELDKLVREQTAKIETSPGGELELLETPAQEKLRREQELQAALAAEIKSQDDSVLNTVPAVANRTADRVDVGWVVQVGLFTEKNRSTTLISELKNKGFDASSSVVDTNRGLKTGTRVWLGPFSKRAAALSEKRRLKSKAGKEGFIRVYP